MRWGGGRVVGARRPRRDAGVVGGWSLRTGGWWTHGLPPVGKRCAGDDVSALTAAAPIDAQVLAGRSEPRRRRPRPPRLGPGLGRRVRRRPARVRPSRRSRHLPSPAASRRRRVRQVALQRGRLDTVIRRGCSSWPVRPNHLWSAPRSGGRAADPLRRTEFARLERAPAEPLVLLPDEH